MKAVIFDMDGVIVNSTTHRHEERSRIIREEFGLTDVETERLIGLNARDKYDYLVEHAGLAVDREAFLETFDQDIERVYTEHVDLLSDFEATLRWLGRRAVKAGLASASNRERVELVVDRFDLDEDLDAIVSADDISGASKPDPAIYLHAASELGVDPSDCVAVEDSTHGAIAATEAGTYCVGYAPSYHPEQDLGAADEVVADPAELHARLKALVRDD